MGQKEFFINAIDLIDIHGATNVPTSLLYKSGKQPCIGSEALSKASDRDELNEDFKVDVGNQKPGMGTSRRFRCGDGVNRSAAELTGDFLHETLVHVSAWLGARDIKKGTNILIAEPLAMQEDLISEGWLAANIDTMPSSFGACVSIVRFGLARGARHKRQKSFPKTASRWTFELR